MYKHICEFSATADTQYLFLHTLFLDAREEPNAGLFLLCFSSFEFHEYLKLLRFQQVSCPESEVGFFHKLYKTFSPFTNFAKVFINRY